MLFAIRRHLCVGFKEDEAFKLSGASLPQCRLTNSQLDRDVYLGDHARAAVSQRILSETQVVHHGWTSVSQRFGCIVFCTVATLGGGKVAQISTSPRIEAVSQQVLPAWVSHSGFHGLGWKSS